MSSLYAGFNKIPRFSLLLHINVTVHHLQTKDIKCDQMIKKKKSLSKALCPSIVIKFAWQIKQVWLIFHLH